MPQNFPQSLTLLLGFTLLAMALSSCQKEHLSTVPSNESQLPQALAVPNYPLENGMLVLSHFAEVEELVQQLQTLEKPNANREAAYLQIGITPAMRNGTANYTDHPVCQQFENERGYTSLRSTEETKLFAQLEAGDESVNSIIDRPYLKTLLNEYGAIKIGNRIFKLYDSDLCVLIPNSDWNTFETIKELPENEIREGYNVRLLGVDSTALDPFYEFDATHTAVAAKKVRDLQIRQEVQPDGSIVVSNHSWVENDSNKETLYEWKYPDGSTSVGLQPDWVYQPGEVISVRTGAPDDGWDEDWWHWNAEDRACAVGDFLITPLGNNTFRFDFPPGGTSWLGFNIFWQFGDGTSGASFPIMHTYAPGVSGVVQVTCQYKRSNGTLACERTENLEIDPECNRRGNQTAKQDFSNIGGDDWRLDCKIWIDGSVFTTGDIGSRSKSLKKGFAGAFYGANAQEIWISLEGVYFRRQNGNCNVQQVPYAIESETDSGNVQRNKTDTNDPRIYPFELWSTHQMKVNGQILKYTQNGGKYHDLRARSS